MVSLHSLSFTIYPNLARPLHSHRKYFATVEVEKSDVTVPNRYVTIAVVVRGRQRQLQWSARMILLPSVEDQIGTPVHVKGMQGRRVQMEVKYAKGEDVNLSVVRIKALQTM